MLDDIPPDPNKDKTHPQELDSSSLVSLSVIGVRFRCPNCDYVDVNLKFVRDHMRENHKGKKSRELQPHKQEMKVKIKPPRIYKETLLKSIAYYKSFGGQFFSSSIKANVKFVKDPVNYIRNIRDTGKPQDKPCPKRFKKFFRDKREASVPSSLEVSSETTTISYEKPKQKTNPKKKITSEGVPRKKVSRKSLDSSCKSSKEERKTPKKSKVPKDQNRTAKTVPETEASNVEICEGKKSENQTEEIKTPENSESDFSLNEAETMASIKNFFDMEETVNVIDLMEDMHSILSQDNEMNYESIIGEDSSLPDPFETLENFQKTEDIPAAENQRTETEVATVTEENFNSGNTKVWKGGDPALATTCHQCKKKSDQLKSRCRKVECSPAKSFCKKCLKKYNEEFSVVMADPQWICPFCRQICTCSSCQRTPSAELDQDSYQDYVNAVNKSLKDFSWSRRSYNLNIENVGSREKYRGLVSLARKQCKQTERKKEEQEEEEETAGRSKLTRRSRGGKVREGEALQALLSHLLAQLVEKDVNKWFSVPIDDRMAPGYSKVVKKPMDFTRMENKLDRRSYETVGEFREDFRLICQNCVKFNKPDTSYHKAARKLELFGLDLLSEKNLRQFVTDRRVYSSLTRYELGFDVNEERSKEKLSSNSSEKDTLAKAGKELEEFNQESHLENIFISAAERVKLGRKRGQSSSENQRVPKKQKRCESPEDTDSPRSKASDLPGRETEQPLAHHDYFGQLHDEAMAENAPARQSTAEKMRSLHLEKSEGTYVQCCREECKKWRFLTEYEDPAQVPEYWECSMNQDQTANLCLVGGEEEGEVDFVNVKFTCGSVVWARVKGYPWWPAIIDYCPDSEEYYWIEEAESRTDPAWYHVVFLEKSVSRSWVRAELVEKMTSPVKQPTNLGVKKNSSSMKARLKNALEMATDCRNLPLKERLKKYSFASLFKGKWGEYSDVSSDEETEDGGVKKKTKTKIPGMK